jgi:hypothetical protein
MSETLRQHWTINARLTALHLDDFTDDELARARRYLAGFTLLGTAETLRVDFAIAKVLVERKEATSPATTK